MQRAQACRPSVELIAGPELAEDGEDRVLALANELDVLALRDLPDLAACRDLALGHLLERHLLQRLLLLAQRVREVVRPAERRGIRAARRRAGDRQADPGGQDEDERSAQEREEPLPHVSPLVDGDPLHGVRRRAARPYRRHPEKRNREPSFPSIEWHRRRRAAVRPFVVRFSGAGSTRGSGARHRARASPRRGSDPCRRR